MSRKVKPLQVSVIIKGTRYISLCCGILYGIMKLNTLRAYETTAKPKRLKMYQEQEEREKFLQDKYKREELMTLIREINDPELEIDLD